MAVLRFVRPQELAPRWRVVKQISHFERRASGMRRWTNRHRHLSTFAERLMAE